MNTRTRLAIIAASFVLGALVLACGSGSSASTTNTGSTGNNTNAATSQSVAASTSAPTTNQVAAVGDRVEGGGVALTVEKVEHAPQIGDYQKPIQQGNEFVIASVLIENTGSNKQPYNPLYFKLKDGDGHEYNATISTSNDSLKTGELVAGDKARGSIAVEVPASATGLVLSYQVISIGAGDPLRVKLDK